MQNSVRAVRILTLGLLLSAVGGGASSVGASEASNDSGKPTSITNVYYKNCTEARQAGAAPIYRGEPGYRPGLDRDNDGIAYE